MSTRTISSAVASSTGSASASLGMSSLGTLSTVSTAVTTASLAMSPSRSSVGISASGSESPAVSGTSRLGAAPSAPAASCGCSETRRPSGWKADVRLSDVTTRRATSEVVSTPAVLTNSRPGTGFSESGSVESSSWSSADETL